jgi:hypothetical protein
MNEEFPNRWVTNPAGGEAEFIRVADGPKGSQVLSGKWEVKTTDNGTEAGTLTTYHSPMD